MKKIITFFVAFFMLLSFSSCRLLSKYEYYEDYRSYHVINNSGELFFDSISEINIDWVKGRVTIKTTDEYTGILVKEVTKESYDEDLLCRLWKDGKELNIKYCASNTTILNDVSKELIIYLPKNYVLDSLEISLESASLDISEINVNELDIDNISGTINVTNVHANEIDYDGVSGSFTTVLSPITKELSIEQVSGSSIISLPHHATGFTLKHSTISGKFNSDVELSSNNKDEYYYLQKDYLLITLNSVSGNLSVVKHICSEDPVE